jgi:hypothetical protein
MRDGRLIRSAKPEHYTVVDGTLLVTEMLQTVALTPLGNRKRYIDFGASAIEERMSDKTSMYLR